MYLHRSSDFGYHKVVDSVVTVNLTQTATAVICYLLASSSPRCFRPKTPTDFEKSHTVTTLVVDACPDREPEKIMQVFFLYVSPFSVDFG